MHACVCVMLNWWSSGKDSRVGICRAREREGEGMKWYACPVTLQTVHKYMVCVWVCLQHTYIPAFLHAYLPVHISIYQFIYPSIHLSVCPLPIQPLIDLRVCFHRYMYLFIDLSIHVFYPSMYISIYVCLPIHVYRYFAKLLWCLDAEAHSGLWLHLRIQIWTYLHISHVCIRVCLHVCMSVCLSVRMHVGM